ncbi:MAG TPA: choice-of-anchor tandem repeat GloVer-containing protein [Steroidobacteraceae bacterium]|nr:choice-of-anchor tandem repeat GloVer-containing protein [Steroidobacteraceae bacterium]
MPATQFSLLRFISGSRRAISSLAIAVASLSLVAFGQSATPAVSTIIAFSASETTAPAILGPDGALYGTARVTVFGAAGLIYRAAPDGSEVSTLYQLGDQDGVSPQAGLVLGSDGRFYGTTTFGAVANSGTFGTVFSVRTDGSGFTTLYTFAPTTGSNSITGLINPDGVYPDTELIEGSDGYLYGAAQQGGRNGTGTIFRLSRDGSAFDLLHEFGPITSDPDADIATNDDGHSPAGSLLEGADGYLYGTAFGGGENGRGTVFRLRHDGSGFQVVYAFSAATAPDDVTLPVNADGAAPLVGLTDGGDALLYGVASQGGATGNGTVFAIAPDGSSFTTLHDFDGSDGARPAGALLLGSDGRLYGTTNSGGTNEAGAVLGLGVIFSIARDGTGFEVLHAFDSTYGANPAGALLQLSDTVFVGTTENGGNCGQGTLYRLSLAGDTVDGITNCGRKKNNNSGGGSSAPAVLLLLGLLGLRRRRG